MDGEPAVKEGMRISWKPEDGIKLTQHLQRDAYKIVYISHVPPYSGELELTTCWLAYDMKPAAFEP